MSIRTKILTPIFILAVVLVAAILGSNVYQFIVYVDSNMDERVNVAANVATNELDMLKSQSVSAALYIAESSDVKAAISAADGDALTKTVTKMVRETGIGFCTITDGDGLVLARTAEAGSVGDNLSSRAYVSSALAGNNYTGIVQGSNIAFSVRSGVPVYGDNGGIIGVISTGFRLDTNDYVDSIKAQLGCEVTVFLGDTRISTTVIKEDGNRATGTKAADNVSSIVLGGSAYTGVAQILGIDALTKYTPIHDADGKVVGMLFVGRYISEKSNTVWSFVKSGLIITAVLLILIIPIFLFIVKRIVDPINTTVEAANALAIGDTDISVQVNTKDETKKLAVAFNNMIENTRKQTAVIEDIASGNLTMDIVPRCDKDSMNFALRHMLDNLNSMFREIHSAADQVSSGSRQIADGAQTLAQGSTQQASAIEQLSASIGQIVVKTTNNVEIATEASRLSDDIKGSAEKGNTQMDQMMVAVKEINDASIQIEKVIKVIDDIAFQTNILALNAAVEAARAGSAGKGFAVVAEEVRNLAAKSAEAAKDTSGLIQNSVTKANMGLSIATETAASLSEIVEGINRSAEIIAEIARSSDEQAGAIEQINTGIDQVTEVVHQNNATAQVSASASEEMSSQSDLLQELVARFKIKSAELPEQSTIPRLRDADNMGKY